tara:strand:+ start:725 stop:1000 length:276 start_codon:yes stop_codon:yes gene_type:complete
MTQNATTGQSTCKSFYFAGVNAATATNSTRSIGESFPPQLTLPESSVAATTSIRIAGKLCAGSVAGEYHGKFTEPAGAKWFSVAAVPTVYK